MTWIAATKEQYDICVVGGGPAGSVTALRLATFGYRVCLVERCAFPRPHVGESLTRGVLPILDALGLRESFLEEGRFLEPGETLVRWAEPRTERLAPSQRGLGLFVDRADFDAVLLRGAAAAGVRIFQPGRISRVNSAESGWQVEVVTEGESLGIVALFLVDATGRNGFLHAKRQRVAPRTLALCGYVQAQDRPRATRVEALGDAWCWGALIPGELFSIMVFLDPSMLLGLKRGDLEPLWRSCLAKAELFRCFSDAPLAGPVIARDATPYSAQDVIGPSWVRVGEASFSLDPLSSTGVEKAMQAGQFAALALHTVIERPERKELCEKFYRDRSKDTVASHSAWSSSFYAEVERYRDRPFWQARSGVLEHRQPESSFLRSSFQEGSITLSTRVRLSDKAHLVEEPCIVNDQIQPHPALFHPHLDRPVAFVDGADVGILLGLVPHAADLQQLLALWSSRIPVPQARRIAVWLLNNQILEPVS